VTLLYTLGAMHATILEIALGKSSSIYKVGLKAMKFTNAVSTPGQRDEKLSCSPILSMNTKYFTNTSPSKFPKMGKER
jgi:hypothetical protein